jgi:hypothetical protein
VAEVARRLGVLAHETPLGPEPQKRRALANAPPAVGVSVD